ncbi:VanW family protein [Pseudactinotalea sp.]|uniref:VanW family protein n=1 Tax=Pseudactinotalea sp. TaxID=1926260 RepID=UPI003B3B7EC6
MIFRRSVKDTGVTPAQSAPGGDDATSADPDQTEVRAPEEAAPTEADPDATQVREPEPDPEATAVREPAETAAGETAEAELEESDPVPPQKKRRRGRKIALGVGIGVVVLAGAYVGAAWYLGDKVPQSTTVAGVDISGQTASEAVDTLETRLSDVVSGPIPIEMGETSSSLDPVEAGLAFDATATVGQITGFTLDPQVVFGHLFGLGAREPVVEIDDDALTSALQDASNDLDVAPIDGVIEIAGGEGTVTTEPADGIALDVPAAAELVASQWLTGQRPFELPSETTTPTIDDAAIDATMTDIVEPLLSSPVTVQLNDDETSLGPEILSEAASLDMAGATASLVIDGEVLADYITDNVESVGETPKDAQIVLEGGEPTIIPAVTGTGLDPEQLAGVVADAAVKTGDERVAAAELADAEPEFTTADAEELGVEEIVGEYSTPYPYDPTRTQNLINGTAHISGTLIKPGEVFSLIEALGPITAANGYVSSHVVDGGFVTDAMGGGLSQVSTTTFNAAYEAGMEDIEHKPHSRWFERYPAGREATMFAPSLDMKWGNNTPYGVLVQAWVGDDGHVHVRLWSTEYWDVEVRSSDKYAYTSARTVYNQNDNCQPESGGASGFTIDISRTVARNGEDSEYSGGYSWTYSPWNTVVCGAPPSEGDDEDEDD